MYAYDQTTLYKHMNISKIKLTVKKYIFEFIITIKVLPNVIPMFIIYQFLRCA